MTVRFANHLKGFFNRMALKSAFFCLCLCNYSQIYLQQEDKK